MGTRETGDRKPATATCLGVGLPETEGREPGDGKALLIISAKPSVTRFTGSDIVFTLSRGLGLRVSLSLACFRLRACGRYAETSRPHRSRTMLAHVALHPIAIDMSPAEAGSEFRSPMARRLAICPA